MRKIENKSNIHFFGLPPITVISFPCAARMCLLLIKNANLDLKGEGVGFGGFYGDRSDLALRYNRFPYFLEKAYKEIKPIFI